MAKTSEPVGKHTHHRKKSQKKVESSSHVTPVDSGLQNHRSEKSRKERISGDVKEAAKVQSAAMNSKKIQRKAAKIESSTKDRSKQAIAKLKSSFPGDRSATKNTSGRVRKSCKVESMSLCILFVFGRYLSTDELIR